jgi:selenide,water dikinase
MQDNTQPVLRDLVLIGGGHSHVGVIRMFAMKPLPGLRITLVCTDVDTPYSGMLPGYVAGHYSFDEVHIDLVRLCAWAGVRFLQDEVIGIDRTAQRVQLKNRSAIDYDLVSINTGSTPTLPATMAGSQRVVPVKPIARFNQRWLSLLERVCAQDRSWTLAVVGAGAGGVEMALALQWRLHQALRLQHRDTSRLRIEIFAAGGTILPTHNRRVRALFADTLRRRGITVHLNTAIRDQDADGLVAHDGRRFPVDETLWVTQAGGANWLRDTGLALDAHGFIRVDETLRSLTDPLIFAAGDVTAFDARPLEKAGVFAVRMGAPLAGNLRAVLTGRAPTPWRPQRHWLALISTGDRHAVASRGPIGFAGDWVWRWKDWIDRRFMRRFSDLPPMSESATPAAETSPAHGIALKDEEARQALSAIAMRCGGCGAKVGATVLSRALSELEPVRRSDVILGLDAPDDAAVVKVPPGKAMVHTVDFFRAFIDDPYVFGEIAAVHALGDLYAMGAEPQSATAILTVPPGLEVKTEALLRQLMSGALSALNAAGCALVGGHTGEGRELALGFALNGLIDESLQSLTRKAGLRPGDQLILTKPIGTGTLFAAHGRGAARGRWISAAIASMRQPGAEAVRMLRAHGASACTDVTGFGLLGHLIEMTRPSGVDVAINLAAIPMLDGAVECVQAGLLSSLQPDNLRLRRALRNGNDYASDPRYALLFDPQTAGGMLAGVPSEQAQACVQMLKSAGFTRAAIIGEVLAPSDALEPVLLRDS